MEEHCPDGRLVAAQGSPLAVESRLTWARLFSLTVVGCLGWLVSLSGRQLVGRVTEMYPLAAGPTPYFLPDHALLLYVQTPLVVIGSFLYFLWPGLLLALVLGQAKRAAEWILWGFGFSYLLVVALSTSAKLLLGPPLGQTVFTSLWLAVCVLVTLVAGAQVALRRARVWPITGGTDRRRLLCLPIAVWAGVVALLPKVFWENFNLDGVEAFEFSRSLVSGLFVRGEVQEGVFGFYDRLLTFAYPNHWFMTILEPVEAAVRLPFFLYLVGIFCALTLLIEHETRRSLTWVEEGAIWCSVAVYTVVQSFNTSYEPFFNDLAEPAGTDAILMLSFLAACYAYLRSKNLWFAWFGLLTYSATPAGTLLLLSLLVTVYFSKTPMRVAKTRVVLGLIAVCAVIGIGHELYNLATRSGIRDQFSSLNMLRRLYPPHLTEFHRLNALIFPSGILPALTLPMVRRRDETSWIMTGVTVGCFGVLYVQAWTSLHQFAPVMLLPVVVFWRVYLRTARPVQRWLLPAAVVCAMLSFYLSLPPHFQINHAVRDFGTSIRYEVGDYEVAYEEAVKGGRSLYLLVPEDYRLEYPNQPWGADAASLIHYANRREVEDARINYIVRGSADPAPPEARLLGTVEGVSVYVRDPELWQRQIAPELPRIVQSPLYEPIQRTTFAFFREVARRARERQATEGDATLPSGDGPTPRVSP